MGKQKLANMSRKELIKYIEEIRPKADAYDRVCQYLGIKHNVIGHLTKLKTDKPTTIKQMVLNYMSVDKRNLCLAGMFDVQDFNNISGVINNTLDNFIIIDNQGGKPFDIILDSDRDGKLAKQILKKMKHDVFCYKINGKETIIKDIL